MFSENIGDIQWQIYVNTVPKCTFGGYGAVHIGGADFEARKRIKVDLISFDMVIKIKVVKFECTTEHSSYCYSFHTW